MTDRETMKMALDALVDWDARGRLRTIEALRAALAQPEPIAFMRPKFMIDDGWDELGLTKSSDDDVPLYTAPPQREWIWLADWEESQLMADYGDPPYELVRDVQLKLKEKNYDK